MICKLAYLNFMDICRRDYDVYAQKDLSCFAILFQNSNFTNYT